MDAGNRSSLDYDRGGARQLNKLLEWGILYVSGLAFLSAFIMGLVFCIQNGPATVSYLIPPGTFGHTPLYFPVVPYNLVIFSVYGFFLLWKFKAYSLPLFFFTYCIWDMTTIQFQEIPRIYFVIYILLLALSYLLSRGLQMKFVNVWTILMLLDIVRTPIQMFVQLFFLPIPYQPYLFVANQLLYDAVFFMFVRATFAINTGDRKESHASSDNWWGWTSR